MLHSSHRIPIAVELPCAGNNTKAAAILCISCDAHVSKHVLLLLLILTRELFSFFGEEFTLSSSSLIQLAVL